MAVVIRLQGLPMVAGTMDIRHFFSGLTIPDGGVHIVGGDLGEAFVMFATDEDARIGMMRSGGTIKTSKISLLLSSKTEMQNVIEQSRRRYEVGSSGGNTVSVVSMEGPPLVASVCPAGNNMQGTPPISGTTIPPPLGGPSPTLASGKSGISAPLSSGMVVCAPPSILSSVPPPPCFPPPPLPPFPPCPPMPFNSSVPLPISCAPPPLPPLPISTAHPLSNTDKINGLGMRNSMHGGVIGAGAPTALCTDTVPRPVMKSAGVGSVEITNPGAGSNFAVRALSLGQGTGGPPAVSLGISLGTEYYPSSVGSRFPALGAHISAVGSAMGVRSSVSQTTSGSVGAAVSSYGNFGSMGGGFGASTFSELGGSGPTVPGMTLSGLRSDRLQGGTGELGLGFNAASTGFGLSWPSLSSSRLDNTRPGGSVPSRQDMPSLGNQGLLEVDRWPFGSSILGSVPAGNLNTGNLELAAHHMQGQKHVSPSPAGTNPHSFALLGFDASKPLTSNPVVSGLGAGGVGLGPLGGLGPRIPNLESNTGRPCYDIGIPRFPDLGANSGQFGTNFGDIAMMRNVAFRDKGILAGPPIGGTPIGGTPIGGTPIGGTPIGGPPIGGPPIGGPPIGGPPIGGPPIGGPPIGGPPIGGPPTGGPIGGPPIGGPPIGGPSIGGPSIGGPSIGGPPIGGPPIGGPPIGGPPIGAPPIGGPPIGGPPIGGPPIGGPPIGGPPIGGSLIGGPPIGRPPPSDLSLLRPPVVLPPLGALPIGSAPPVGGLPIGGVPPVGGLPIGGLPIGGVHPVGGPPIGGAPPVGGHAVSRYPSGGFAFGVPPLSTYFNQVDNFGVNDKLPPQLPIIADDLHVRLYNMPFSANEVDVRMFFDGLALDSIVFTRDHMSRLRGEAFVRFLTARDAIEGMRRHRKTMGNRSVEVYPATEKEWRMSLDQFGAKPEFERPRLSPRMGSRPGSGTGGGGTGLPVIAALANLAGMPEIVGGSGATTSGNALPFLPNISERHHRSRSRSPGLSCRSSGSRSRSRSPSSEDNGCVHMCGLPYYVNKDIILRFFNKLMVVMPSLYVVFGPDGTCAGEAFVEFKTGADFRIALSHHKQYLGSNLISVHPIPKHCMMEKVEEFKRRQSVKSNNGRESESKSQKLQGGKGQLVYVGNIPSGVQKKDLQNFFRGFGVIESDIDLMYNKKGECIGQAIVTFASREVASRALRLNRVKLGGREVILHLVTHEQLCELQENLHSDSDTRRISMVFSHRADVAGAQPPALLPSLLPRPSSQPHSDGFLRPGVPTPPLPPLLGPGLPPLCPPPNRLLPNDLGTFNVGPKPLLLGTDFPCHGLKPLPSGGDFPAVRPALSDGVGGFSKSAPHAPTPGAVVRIQNLPSKVDRDEILDFFYGYRVIPDSVHVPLSHPHLPTNEAFVSFENPEEAASAVRELNDRPIGSLKVKLVLL